MIKPASLRLVAVLGALLCAPAYSNTLVGNTLEALREADKVSIGETRLLSSRLLADFYAQRGNELAWRSERQVAALLEVIEKSAAEGFDPLDFHVASVRGLARKGTFDRMSASERLGADIRLTDALLRYVHHTRFGKLDPVSVDAKWNDRAPVPADALIADMSGALDAPRLDRFLSERFERPFWYRDLVAALANLRAMEGVGDLPPLPAGSSLSKGSNGPRVALLRERLQLLGHAAKMPPGDLERFDEGLAATVRAFQARAGLSQDGVVGPRTLQVINGQRDEDTVERVRINLERMRWLLNDLPTDYVLVDVADFMAYVVRSGEVAWSTRVIVGSAEDQTPMFREVMEHVVLNPTWSVPISIQKEMKSVSASYTLVDRRTGRQVSGGDAADYKRYRIVQKPGPKNALGRVKFMFPNRHAVYLHDTPNRGLFGRSNRALSHGCVRVQDPLTLAEVLLGESGWERADIEAAVDRSKTRYINLDSHLTVLLYYLTARAGDSGLVDLRRDIYQRDPALKAAFSRPVSAIRIAFPEPSPIEPVGTAPPASGNGEGARPASQGAPESEDAPSGQEAPSQNGVRLTQAERVDL